MGQTTDSLKHGLQVGAGFFIGYFLMRFLSLAAMVVATVLIGMAVCVPKCEEYDRHIITPVENATGVQLISSPQIMWPDGCRVRARPSTHSRVIGHVVPGRGYYKVRKRGRWTRVVGITTKGWVGCPSRPYVKMTRI